MITLNQSTKTDQNYAIWILTGLLFILTPDVYEDIANDVEELFDTANYNNNRPFPIGKNKKSNWSF